MVVRGFRAERVWLATVLMAGQLATQRSPWHLSRLGA